jgi:hypothetical protein
MGNGGKMVCQKHARCIFVTKGKGKGKGKEKKDSDSDSDSIESS